MKPKRQAGKRTRRMWALVWLGPGDEWHVVGGPMFPTRSDAIEHRCANDFAIPVDVPVGRTTKKEK